MIPPTTTGSSRTATTGPPECPHDAEPSTHAQLLATPAMVPLLTRGTLSCQPLGKPSNQISSATSQGPSSSPWSSSSRGTSTSAISAPASVAMTRSARTRPLHRIVACGPSATTCRAVSSTGAWVRGAASTTPEPPLTPSVAPITFSSISSMSPSLPADAAEVAPRPDDRLATITFLGHVHSVADRVRWADDGDLALEIELDPLQPVPYQRRVLRKALRRGAGGL